MKEVGGSHKQWRGHLSSTCKQCPVAYASPVCGSDGHSYSSQVRAVLFIQYEIKKTRWSMLWFECDLTLEARVLECGPIHWYCSGRFWNLQEITPRWRNRPLRVRLGIFCHSPSSYWPFLSEGRHMVTHCQGCDDAHPMTQKNASLHRILPKQTHLTEVLVRPLDIAIQK